MLPPALLQELSRRKLAPLFARAASGVGERPSGAKGAGMEFTDHRTYQPGDDIRALDAQVSARLGVPVVREYTVYQQLQVLLVLDASAGMRIGKPAKFTLARQLAATLAFVALAGGDQVQLAAFGEGLHTSARFQGLTRATALLGWLGGLRAAGHLTLQEALGATAGRAPRRSLVIVVGDFLHQDSARALGVAYARAQEVLAVQVLAPEELDPRALGGGAVRLADVHGGASTVVTLDDATRARYDAALQDWVSTLRGEVTRQRGRFVQVSADTPLQQVVLRELLTRGIIQ